METEKIDLRIHHMDPSLYNSDLAPLPPAQRKWGWFEIFNVWSNDIQSLFGYTLAATLFISYGLNGWTVFAGIILAGIIVNVLVNLTGKPGVKYGIPYPVIARASMGVRGANFPALIRGIVAIFWYGVQPYFAATAVALLLNSLLQPQDPAVYMGLTAIGWLSYVIVCLFQVGLFVCGMSWITRFLNWAGPLVSVEMIALMTERGVPVGPDPWRLVRAMVAAGLATANRDGPDRRATQLRLAPAGLRVLKKGSKRWRSTSGGIGGPSLSTDNCTPPSSRWARVTLSFSAISSSRVSQSSGLSCSRRKISAARLRWAVGLLMIFWMRTPSCS